MTQPVAPWSTAPWARVIADARFWSRVDTSGECWTWTGALSTSGYGRVYWNGRRTPSHRASWEMTKGSIPDGLHVLHHCDNPPCVRPAHLFVGTPRDNAVDRDQKKRRSYEHLKRAAHVRGEAVPGARLTEAQVPEIRRLAAAGVPRAEIARQFGVSWGTVDRAIKGRSWSHV